MLSNFHISNIEEQLINIGAAINAYHSETPIIIIENLSVTIEHPKPNELLKTSKRNENLNYSVKKNSLKIELITNQKTEKTE